MNASDLSKEEILLREVALQEHGLRAAQRLFISAAAAAEDVIEAAIDGDDARAERRLDDARRLGRIAAVLAGEPIRGEGARCRACGCTDPTPCVDVDGEACGWAETDLCSACASERGRNRQAE